MYAPSFETCLYSRYCSYTLAASCILPVSCTSLIVNIVLYFVCCLGRTSTSRKHSVIPYQYIGLIVHIVLFRKSINQQKACRDIVKQQHARDQTGIMCSVCILYAYRSIYRIPLLAGALPRPAQLEERVQPAPHARVEVFGPTYPGAQPQLLPRRHTREERLHPRRMTRSVPPLLVDSPPVRVDDRKSAVGALVDRRISAVLLSITRQRFLFGLNSAALLLSVP